MRAKTTLLMILIAAVLGGAIVGVDHWFPSTREADQLRDKPLQFESAKVDRIEVGLKDASLTLVREGAFWRVAAPFQDLAAAERVQRLLDAMQSTEWLEPLMRGEFEEAEWAKTGLADSGVSVLLLSEGRPVSRCWFGSQAALEGSYYAAIPDKKEGERKYFMVRSSVPVLLQSPVQEWRDPKLLQLPVNSISKVILSTDATVIELSRNSPKDPWRLMKPLQTRAGDEKVTELLSTLLNLEIGALPANASTPATTSPGAADPSTPSVNELKVTVVAHGAEKPFEMTLSRPEPNQQTTRASVSHRSPVFTVSSKTLQSLWAQPNDLRDDRLAHLEEQAVAAIRIESRVLPPVLLTREGGTWLLERHGKREPANGERVAALFESFNTQRIREFAADSAANLASFGLDVPFLTFSWTPVSAGATTDAEAGGNAILFGQDEKGSIFAKVADEPFVYRVSASLLNGLPPDGAKWKGLTVLHFSQFALRRVSISYQASPPVVLDHNPVTAEWSGSVAGKDITRLIDRVKADRLASELSNFQAQEWASERAAGLEALKNPAIRLQVSLGEPGKEKSPVNETVLNFAPTQPGMETAIFYGQLEGSPDVFFVTREYLRKVLATVLKHDSP